jgi:HEAT repeat protein
LVAEFRRERRKTLRWTIGSALYEMASDEVVGDLLKLAGASSYGEARQMIVLGLGKVSARPPVVRLLVALLSDDDVIGHAVIALGKLRASSARAEIAALSRHPKSWIRREVKKALERIGRASKISPTPAAGRPATPTRKRPPPR